jgi:hypothetical protein
MIENLIIFARRLFKHKHRLARGTEQEKILMVDPQFAPVSQVKSDGLPVGPNGFEVLNFHGRKTLTDVPSVFHSDPQSAAGILPAERSEKSTAGKMPAARWRRRLTCSRFMNLPADNTDNTDERESKASVDVSPSPEGEQVRVLFYPRNPRNPWLRRFFSAQMDTLNAS